MTLTSLGAEEFQLVISAGRPVRCVLPVGRSRMVLAFSRDHLQGWP